MGLMDSFCFFFFFQAEDGIRDLTVTGVQTCALPISGVRAEAERILLEADFGVAATEEILAQVERVPDGDLQRALEQAVTRVLAAAASPGGRAGEVLAHASQPPTVILVYGVNGVGKTTTIAKLARLLER